MEDILSRSSAAVHFSLPCRPENAIIADSNPELVNMYRQVANNLDDVIDYLKKYKNTSEMFYQVRALEWTELPPAEAAARTIYLNRTVLNGCIVSTQGSIQCSIRKVCKSQI